MISVLIPAYNENPVELCKKIEAHSRDIRGFEILIGDDYSDKPIETLLEGSGLSMTRVIRNPENLGYNLNRNMLARNAKNEVLLFLDADVMPLKSTFIYFYYREFERSVTQYVCGGLEYPGRPEDPDLMLKWKHGKEREVVSPELRMQNPGRSITTSNLAVRRSVFLENTFLEKKTGYGYNDTIYGLLIETKGLQIKHIYNPVVHEGLIPAMELIQRSEQAAKNLKFLSDEDEYSALLTQIKLFSAYQKLRLAGLIPLVRGLLSKREQRLKDSLLSSNPNLKHYDQLRLLYLLRAMKE